MVRAEILIWISFVVLVSAVSVANGFYPNVGVNWGNMLSHPLDPKIVVQMLKDNGIKKVKLFDSDPRAVGPLVGSGIEAMLAIPNDELEHFTNYDTAKKYVKKNVTTYMNKGGVDIRYIAVGNEPFLKSYNGTFIKSTFPAMQNVQRALEEAGFGDKIKATTPLNSDVYDSQNNVPSSGAFRPDIRKEMIEIVKFLYQKKSAFVVNIYPFLSLYANENFPVDFAFFDGANNPTNDKGKQYTNVFDANYDTLVWSLKKAGYDDLKIIVGEVGWPTDGDKQATVPLAYKFYKGLMKKIAKNKGTPMRPKLPDMYLFGLLDENQKSIAPGNFERHWGIFRYDGQPKFPIDLTGDGHEKLPVGAKGVKYLAKQWCVFDPTVTDMSLVPPKLDYACSLADCTPLGYGSSCNKLDKNGNISYAFNIYFQMQSQDSRACDFDGLSILTDKNASSSGCLFPIEVQSQGEKQILVSLTLSILLLFLVVALM